MLITNNANDFCKSEPVRTNPNIFRINPQLDNGADLFSVFTSLYDFFLFNFNLPIEYNKDTGGFLHKVQFDYTYLAKLVFYHSIMRLGDEVAHKLALPSADKLFNRDNNSTSEIAEMQILKLDDHLEFDNLTSGYSKEYFIIKGNLLKPIIQAYINDERIETTFLVKVKSSFYLNTDVAVIPKTWGMLCQIEIKDPEILELNV